MVCWFSKFVSWLCLVKNFILSINCIIVVVMVVILISKIKFILNYRVIFMLSDKGYIFFVVLNIKDE